MLLQQSSFISQLLGIGKVVNNMDKIGVLLGVVGGIGLGILLGSEFSGTTITLVGAGIMIIFFLALGILTFLKKP